MAEKEVLTLTEENKGETYSINGRIFKVCIIDPNGEVILASKRKATIEVLVASNGEPVFRDTSETELGFNWNGRTKLYSRFSSKHKDIYDHYNSNFFTETD